MRRALIMILASLAGATASSATPGEPAAPAIAIERAIVLAADAPGGEVAAYAVFTNPGPDTRIVEARCDCAAALELHLVQRDGPNPGMVTVWPLDLPKAVPVAIEPPGIPRHMMLVSLRQPIAEGERVRMQFKLEDGRWIAQDFVGVKSSVEAWKAFDAAEGK